MQIFVNGLITGLTLALLAVSFNIVYLPTRVFYLALGGIYTIAPFIALTCQDRGVPWYLAALAAVIAGGILSVLCELINHRFLERKQASSEAQMISSLGLYIILAQITVLLWGNETKTLRSGIDGVITYGGVVLTNCQQNSLTISLIMLAVFFCFLRWADAGLHLRALADNPKELALQGYSTDRSRLLCFFISGLFCAISALLTAYDIGFDAHNGLSAILLAIVAIIVGGRSNFVGPVIGALLLVVCRSYVVWLWSARWADAVTFACLAIILLLRPNGLIRSSMRLESNA
jgi:branched-chain amino acid transport system permease protein